MTEPGDEAAAEDSPRLRRAGVVTGAVGALALLVAAVAFWAGGPPYGRNTAAAVVYSAGLLVGLTAAVLLYMSWTHRAPRPPEAGRGIAVAMTALVLVCACTVISLGDAADGGVQIALMAVSAVVLAAAALLARHAT
jgi:peptidoglycan/LPS O-acetylase OafA/YrhL